ncbi:MAG: P-loop NTPase [Calditerrivibrio sp.]|nr:P-loop NTPase [Calditerrivibrio sp.]
MEKNTTIISVASGKGGVGKSNFSLNLSLALAEKNKTTALFDADLSLGNASLLLGTNPQKTILNLVEEDVSINDIVYKNKKYDNFLLIPAGTGITKFANLSKTDKEKITFKINEFKSNVDFFVIDTAAGASDEVLHFIKMSDILILIIIPEITSIKDAYGLLKILKDKEIIKKTYVVINRARSKSQVKNIFEKFEETVKKFLNLDIELLGPIPFNPKISEAVNNQTPILYYEPEGSTANLFRQYANLFSEYMIGKREINDLLSNLILVNKEEDLYSEETTQIKPVVDESIFFSLEQNINKIISEINNINKTIKINLRRNLLNLPKDDYFSEFQVGRELVFIEKNSYYITSTILGWDFGNYLFVKINKKLLDFLENTTIISARYSYQDKLIEFKTKLLHKPSELDEIALFSYPKKYIETSLRGNKRYKVNLGAIILIGNNVYKGKIIDLNQSGALIESEVSMNLEDICRISFVLPDGKLIENIACKVKNIRDVTKYGVSFESISPLSLRRLSNFFEIYERITGGKESITEVKKTEGNLENISPMDLVQVLSISNKICVLELVGNEISGKIYFDKGSVVHAESKNLSGLDAFYFLMELAEGEFLINDMPSSNITQRTISKSTNQLLLDSAFVIDTRKNLLKNKTDI